MSTLETPYIAIKEPQLCKQVIVCTSASMHEDNIGSYKHKTQI